MLLSKVNDLLSLSPARRDLWILGMTAVAGVLNLVLWVLLLWRFAGATEFIILQYTIYFGISALGLWYQILLLPLSGLLIILLNFWIAMRWYLHEALMSYCVMVTAAAVNAILLTAGIFLIYINS
jgi:hypothetical protein